MTRLGTWNLENLARPGGPAAAPDNQRAYEEKLDTLAATITDLHPDVLAVQEVLDPNALDDLIARLNGAWHTALADPDTRGSRVGLLSRTPRSNLEHIRDFPQGLSPVQADDAGATIGQLGRPGLQARKVEQLLDQAREPAGLVADQCAELITLGRCHRRRPHGLGSRDDRRQGRPQIV